MAARLEIDTQLARGDFRLAVARTLNLDGVTALFGASGSGKTTLLRILAGFEGEARGRIAFAGGGNDEAPEIWQDDGSGVFMAPHRRGTGLVFQDARLFLHLSVRGNLDFAVRRAGTDGIAFDDVVNALDLRPLLRRGVAGLSGGERQRVAIGRTLLARPRLLLMDEPLASLDMRRKAEILPCIERVARRFRVPILYVTHNVDEVVRLAERMILVADGQVMAEGKVSEILERLDLQPLTGRFEAGVVLTATVRDHDRAFHLTRLEIAGQDLLMPMIELTPGATVQVRVRARDVALALQPPTDISIRNVLRGRVIELVEEPATAYAEVLVALDRRDAAADEVHVRARITRQAVAALDLGPGTAVHALVKSVSFDRRILSAD